ncbi:hypothetical protein D3C76_1440520 [compost metagenome]
MCLPAVIGSELANLTCQPGQYRCGQRGKAKALVRDPIGQVRQLIQALAQRIVKCQPVAFVELDKTSGAGLHKL